VNSAMSAATASPLPLNKFFSDCSIFFITFACIVVRVLYYLHKGNITFRKLKLFIVFFIKYF
jgi:hypothetical protein